MTRTLRGVSGKRCVKALQRIGFEIGRQSGSHIILYREEPPAQVSVPNHKELDRGTLQGIIKRTGLTTEAFVDLLK
jgi:predicted RNA binding protein YcfA (HicA-like mRNA interferase family)